MATGSINVKRNVLVILLGSAKLAYILTITYLCASQETAKMKYNFVIIALAFTVVAVNAQSINVCENVANYIFLTDWTNCSNYYICVNGQPLAQTCDNGLQFDASTQSCGTTSTTCVSCDKSTLTMVPLIKTCNKYIMCFAGEPILQKCYDNLQYNTVKNQCDLAQNVDCVENSCSITMNDNPSNITYVPSQGACDKYYICMNGKPWSQSCASGLQFSTACNCCDLAANVGCTIKSNKRTSAPVIQTPPQMANIDCPKEGTHFYPHSRSNQYYVCVNGKGAILSCAEGLFYDTKTESCRELEHILVN